MRSKSTLFLQVLFALGGLVVLALLLGNAGLDKKLYSERVAFQQAIGGVGLGSVLVPAWNFSDFDPRLQQSEADQIYPVPSGYSFSPDRLSMVSSFTPSNSEKFREKVNGIE